MPPFKVSEILTWADAYRARHGAWPNLTSGRIPEPPNATSFAQILRWANARHDRTGCWPTERSGSVIGFSGDTWQTVRLWPRRTLRSFTLVVRAHVAYPERVHDTGVRPLNDHGAE
jgi:hypothetical protein